MVVVTLTRVVRPYIVDPPVYELISQKLWTLSTQVVLSRRITEARIRSGQMVQRC